LSRNFTTIRGGTNKGIYDIVTAVLALAIGFAVSSTIYTRTNAIGIVCAVHTNSRNALGLLRLSTKIIRGTIGIRSAGTATSSGHTVLTGSAVNVINTRGWSHANTGSCVTLDLCRGFTTISRTTVEVLRARFAATICHAIVTTVENVTLRVESAFYTRTSGGA